jgi:tRNA-Thr(GGU) m(6)t(6)A37 methyltransferase TsaA
MKPIGFVKTSFQEKFGVPRQSLMVKEARGVLKLNADPLYRDALRYLEDFSHVWIIFIFHEHTDQAWRPTITPPRIDAPGKVGVFASRSPHRPNPIGLSAVKLEKIDFEAKDGIEIHLSGVDLLDGTPVLDLKPYLPYVDCIPEAKGGWTETKIPRYSVTFSAVALQKISDHQNEFDEGDLKLLIEQMLALDPRPTSQRKTMPLEDPKQEGAAFAFRMLNFDVKWEVRQGGIYVSRLEDL